MAKGSTRVAGVYTCWRKTQRGASLRVFVFRDGAQKAISAKVNPTLRQIAALLKEKGWFQEDAEKDPNFKSLVQRLIQDLKSEYGLKAYAAAERVKLQTKQFNFEDSLEEFEKWKSDMSLSREYRNRLEKFWLPFFLGKGCLHPSDFRQYRAHARTHLKAAKTKHGKQYSPASYIGLTAALNQYIKFLVEHEYMDDSDAFDLKVAATQDDFKRGRAKTVRSNDTYSLTELFSIKKKIDATYAKNLEMKLRAYGLYFGACSGLRRGNLLGLKVEDLHPDASVPNFSTRDNVISGWSRGHEGMMVLENATKTFVGTVSLPMLQPSVDVLREVAEFIKDNKTGTEPLIECGPSTVSRWWKEIASECGFRYLYPHTWKHSYATIGALHLTQWYRGNPYFLQVCCMHSDFRTTQRYINQTSSDFLSAFSIPETPAQQEPRESQARAKTRASSGSR